MFLKGCLFGCAGIGAGCSSYVYYSLRWAPLVNYRSQPNPPRRVTPLFATANEGIVGPLPLPRSMSTFGFYWLVMERMMLLAVKLIPLLWHLCLNLVPLPALLGGRGSCGGNKERKKSEGGEELLIVAKCGEEEIGFALCPINIIYDEFVQLLKSMGPTYVKLGQWMATRPDVFPQALVDRLKELFDTVPAHSWKHTEKVLREAKVNNNSSGKGGANQNNNKKTDDEECLMDLLENISREPINSGSVAQVHTATLKRDVIVEPPTESEEDSVVDGDSNNNNRNEKQGMYSNPQTATQKRFSPQAEANVHGAIQFLENHILKPLGLAPQDHGHPVQNVNVLKAGTKVAVKVMHPNTEEMMLADICVMRLAAQCITAIIPGAENFSLCESVAEFAALLLSQVDLRRECDNLLRFRHNFRDDTGIQFPLPIPQYASEKLLIETFEIGTALQNMKGIGVNTVKLSASRLSKEKSDAKSECRNHPDLAALGCRMFLKMLFEDNFVHADLHPGNLFIRYRDPNGDVMLAEERDRKFPLGSPGRNKLKPVMVVLDAGLITSLSDRDRENFIALFSAVACGDGALGARLMMERSPQSNCTDLPSFQKEMKVIFDSVGPNSEHGFSLGEIKMGEVLSSILNTLRTYRIRIDANFTTLVATVIIGEGLGRSLQPEYNIFGEAVPYLINCLENHELSYLITKLQETYGPGGMGKFMAKSAAEKVRPMVIRSTGGGDGEGNMINK